MEDRYYCAGVGGSGLHTEIRPIVTSPAQSRRRATFAARRTKKGTMSGFHGRASGTVIEIPDCQLVEPELLAAREIAEALAELGGSRKATLAVTVTNSPRGLDIQVAAASHLMDRCGLRWRACVKAVDLRV